MMGEWPAPRLGEHQQPHQETREKGRGRGRGSRMAKHGGADKSAWKKKTRRQNHHNDSRSPCQHCQGPPRENKAERSQAKAHQRGYRKRLRRRRETTKKRGGGTCGDALRGKRREREGEGRRLERWSSRRRGAVAHQPRLTRAGTHTHRVGERKMRTIQDGMSPSSTQRQTR